MNSAAARESRDPLAAPLSAPQVLTYALVTPARNEAAFIEQTIRSVIAQTALPRKWIIVSDGSTDGTDEIVQRYAREHDWIELLRMPERNDRQFAAKAHAFNAGYARLSSVHYPLSSDSGFDIIGNLDADITFEPDYFEMLLSKFQLCPELGVAGTPFVEDHDRLDQHSFAHQFANSTHVSGACQMFAWQVTDVVSLRAQSLHGWWPSTLGMLAWFVSDVGEAFCAGRSLVHRRLRLGRVAPPRARRFPPIDAIPSRRTDGAPTAARRKAIPARSIPAACGLTGQSLGMPRIATDAHHKCGRLG
jgi:hypothetical protein